MKKRFLICCVCLVCLLTMSVVAAAPVIIAQPQDYYFPHNQTFPATAHFSVLASGDNLTYAWEYRRSSESTWTTSHQSNTANYSPNVSNAGASDGAYLYRCRISSTEGEVVTDTVSTSVGTYVLTLQQSLEWIDALTDSVFDWAVAACNTIVSEPLLLFTVGFLALGGAIAIVGRLLSRS